MTTLTLVSASAVSAGVGAVVTVSVTVSDSTKPTFVTSSSPTPLSTSKDGSVWSATWATERVGAYVIAVTAGDASPVTVPVTVTDGGPTPTPDPTDTTVAGLIADPESQTNEELRAVATAVVPAASKPLRRQDLDIDYGLRATGERPRVTIATSTQIASGTTYQPTFSGGFETANPAWWVGGTPKPCAVNASVRARAPEPTGGTAQAARYVVARRILSTGPTFEYQGLLPGTSFGYSLVVDGKLATHGATITSPGAAGAFVHVLFDFGVARPRVIDLYVLDQDFYAFKAPTGHTITKPAGKDFGQALYVDGDSLTGGAAGIDRHQMYPLPLALALGYDHVINGAVGGTPWTGGTAGTNIADRLATNVTPYIRPHDGLIIAGSRNGSTTGLTAAITAALATLTSVQQLALIGTFSDLPNNDYVKAGALAAGRPFIEGKYFFTGTGNRSAPAYDGNSDRFFGSSDPVHPDVIAAQDHLARRIALGAVEVLNVPINL